MNRREVLKSSILLTGIFPVNKVMAEKEEKITIIPGGFTIALIDKGGNIASEHCPFMIEAKPFGFTNLKPIKFKNIQEGCELYACIFLSGKSWYISHSFLRPVDKGDTITIEKGDFRLHFEPSN